MGADEQVLLYGCRGDQLAQDVGFQSGEVGFPGLNFLLLFGRMARSYSLQLLLATIVIWYLLAFARRPAAGNLVPFAISLAALFYTHYLPAIALWAGANVLLFAQQRQTKKSPWRAWILCNALVALLYLPWLLTLAGALRQWQQNQVHNVTGNIWAEQILKLGYWFYSFAFGEAIPFWLLPVTALLGVACLWLLLAGARLRREWMWPALLTAAVAYLGVTRWASVPFVSARLLFLLPLFLIALSAGVTIRRRLGVLLGVALVGVNIVGIVAYFHVSDILNVAYTTPSENMAKEIASHSDPADTMVWVDGLNFDDTTLEHYLPNFQLRELTTPESITAAIVELNAGTTRHVWFIRSTHDISPEHGFETLESQMSEKWPEHTWHPYLKLSPTHLAVMNSLARLRHDDRSRREYMYQMWEFRRPGF